MNYSPQLKDVQNVQVSNLRVEAANWKQRKINRITNAGKQKIWISI